MTKAEATKQQILQACMRYVCQYGFQSLSIGEIAKCINMSRTGVISHFANKEDMQIAILKHCEAIFIRQVIQPALNLDPLINLQQFISNWMNWVIKLDNNHSLSCPFIKAAADFQNRDNCKVRQVIKQQHLQSLAYIAGLAQRCVDKGVFKANVNCGEFANEVYAYYLNHNMSKHLLQDENADATFTQQTQSQIARVLNDSAAAL
jgi:AcrR family transcriptional regulator